MNEHKRETLRQLKEIFPPEVISSEIILNFCNEYKWNFDVCIEKLIKYIEDNNVSLSSTVDDALPKQEEVKFTDHESLTENSNDNVLSFARTLQGAIPKQMNNSGQNLNDEQNVPGSSKSIVPLNKTKLEKVIDSVNAGYKIMIILRGAPGCGKTYIARQIIDRTVKGSYEKFICSTDDYFYDVNDRYNYRRDKLDNAHEFNQKKVRKKCADGWSPIIVDNTNIKRWEMLPYVQAAVQNGYDLEIIEPNTPWANSVGKLAKKNLHNVPRDKIERILISYEPCSKSELLQMLKTTTYTVSIPQLRMYPPLPYSIFKEKFLRVAKGTSRTPKRVEENISDSWPSYENSVLIEDKQSKSDPKPPRNIERSETLLQEVKNEENLNKEFSDKSSEWKPYEEESNEFWKDVSNTVKTTQSSDIVAKPKRNEERMLTAEEKICEILKEDYNVNSIETEIKNPILSKQHDITCPLENKSFLMARQMFPKKQISVLWHLFELCKGEINFLIDHVLRDDSCIPDKIDENEELEFCKCSFESVEINFKESSTSEKFEQVEIKNKIIPNNDKLYNDELFVEAKKAIENQFILPDKFYPDHVNQIRKSRGICGPSTSSFEEPIVENTIVGENIENANIETRNSSESESSNHEDTIIEIDLGKNVIGQLEDLFEIDTMIKNNIQNYKTNIFMPRSFAKQLYIFWVESLFNQHEEQKIQTIREDEDFAKLLQENSAYFDKESYEDLLHMEQTWNSYKNNSKQWKNSPPENLAQYLTEMKLQEVFPNIEKETLLDIFETQNKSYADTVNILTPKKSGNPVKKDNNIQLKEFETKEVGKENDEKNWSDEIRRDSALKKFEESRNLAAHYSQLKAECYIKAKEAIQKRQTSVAVYYSQIASLNKSKIDHYNQLAANCIMEVHELTQSNPDFIDLHYLHTVEALECLDIFVDRHITKLRNLSRIYKHIFIITGRGLHSAGGVSTIKNKVKTRLKERNLKWIEVNPGLLRVKIFSASKFTKKS